MKLQEQDWRLLERSIEDGQCVLLLGPGVAVDPDNPDGEPLSVQLSLELAEHLRCDGKGDQIVSPRNLAHVSQVCARAMRRRRPGLELLVGDFFARYKKATTQLHLDLASLPFRSCITTTPERFLLNAFRQTPNKEPVYDYYHFKPNPKRARKRVTPAPPKGDRENHPIVYDLYGSLDEPDSLVLTENDLLDFLVGVTRQSPPLPAHIGSQFTDRSLSFLFVGFGFRHWYVRILLHVLSGGGHEVPSLALEDESFFEAPEHELTSLFFRDGHSIEFYEISWFDFASQLRRRFESNAASDEHELIGSSIQIPEDAPTVFLCHESNDKESVEAIAGQLNDRGIKTWLDKQNLRAGDRWPVLIPKVLETQVDYVVVLQSCRMVQKSESYFFREIQYALQRQNGFRPGVRFIIPTLLEQVEGLPLENLSHLHCIDLTQPEAIDELADSIKDDWQQRQEITTSEAG